MHIFRPLVSALGSKFSRVQPTALARTKHFTQSSVGLPTRKATTVRSMPTIPFLGSWFYSSSSSKNGNNMGEYPDKRGEGEWKAVLSKGKP